MSHPRARILGRQPEVPIGVTLGSFSAILTDVLAWVAAVELAAAARFDFDVERVPWDSVSVLAIALAGAQCLIGGLVLLYRGRYLTGSFDEMRAVAVSATTVAAFATVAVLIFQPTSVPRSVPFVAWPMALAGMGAIRYVKRLIRQAGRRPVDAEPILILGAGWIGEVLAWRMVHDPDSPFMPAAFLDDDPAKRRLRLHGVPVSGRLDDLADVAAETGATSVVVAINGADSALIGSIYDSADAAGVTCLVLPPLSEQLSRSQLQLSALRDVDVQDMIGRRPVDTDVQSIADYITGKRVLVTGAGGSIGSELCRQLHRFGPAEMVMLDRDESALHAVELSITGQALLTSPEIVLANICDADVVDRTFLEHEPQVVFHAAALKHQPLLERYPCEALKTNVHGTLNVLRAAAANGVEHFVNISTDKAADPVSALGHSKRVAERLTAWMGTVAACGEFLSVRFGNVLGSRGSVLHTFAAQIERGGPITVTDPEVTRYFMTIAEACQLVIQAGALGGTGEVLVLDMGRPVKIVDVARRMATIAGKVVDMQFTGLREGEKLHEDIFSAGEVVVRRAHPLISHVVVPPLSSDDLLQETWVRRVSRARPVGPVPAGA
jgi:dTDP-glucose 4,6-dehydratase